MTAGGQDREGLGGDAHLATPRPAFAVHQLAAQVDGILQHPVRLAQEDDLVHADDIGRALRQQQELEEAVMAVLGNLPAIALAAAADVLDVNELRRHGARFAIEGKYRYGRLRLSAGLPHSCYCSAHNDDVLDVMFERKIQKMTRVVHFAAGRMLAKT